MGEGERRDPRCWLCVVGGVSLTFLFAVECEDTTTPGGQDPDDIVEEAAWVPRAVALARLAALPFPRMADPTVAVLTGRAPEGSIWTYDADADGVDQLRTTIPG